MKKTIIIVVSILAGAILTMCAIALLNFKKYGYLTFIAEGERASLRVSEMPVDNSVDNNDLLYVIDKGVSSRQMTMKKLIDSVGYMDNLVRGELADSTAQLRSEIGGGGAFSKVGNYVTLTTPTDYVGIGTALPTEKLEVAGNVKANTFVATDVQMGDNVYGGVFKLFVQGDSRFFGNVELTNFNNRLRFDHDMYIKQSNVYPWRDMILADGYGTYTLSELAERGGTGLPDGWEQGQFYTLKGRTPGIVAGDTGIYVNIVNAQDKGFIVDLNSVNQYGFKAVINHSSTGFHALNYASGRSGWSAFMTETGRDSSLAFSSYAGDGATGVTHFLAKTLTDTIFRVGGEEIQIGTRIFWNKHVPKTRYSFTYIDSLTNELKLDSAVIVPASWAMQMELPDVVEFVNDTVSSEFKWYFKNEGDDIEYTYGLNYGNELPSMTFQKLSAMIELNTRWIAEQSESHKALEKRIAALEKGTNKPSAFIIILALLFASCAGLLTYFIFCKRNYILYEKWKE